MIPVILLGSLALVRTLGMARIPVVVASLERDTPSMASRYCKGIIELPRAAGREAIVESLVRAGRWFAKQHGGARIPLFYDNDDRLALVQDYRDALAPHFALLLNEPAIGRALLDKELFQDLGERWALPVPRRIDWDALAHERGPVLIKPKTRTGWENSAVRRQLFGGEGKARVFASGEEARANALVQTLANQLAFQEYVPGGDDAIWSFHGFAAPGGEVLASFVGRKIRTFPALTGDSAYLRLARDDRLSALGRDIASRLRLAGVFKMDFKRSPAGRFYLLEINTRFNLWHYPGAMNGVNLPQIAYDFLTKNRRPEPAIARSSYRYLAWRYDLRAYRELKAAGKLGMLGWLWSLVQAPKVYELFAWSDPAPYVRWWRNRFERRWQRLWHSTAS